MLRRRRSNKKCRYQGTVCRGLRGSALSPSASSPKNRHAQRDRRVWNGVAQEQCSENSARPPFILLSGTREQQNRHPQRDPSRSTSSPPHHSPPFLSFLASSLHLSSPSSVLQHLRPGVPLQLPPISLPLIGRLPQPQREPHPHSLANPPPFQNHEDFCPPRCSRCYCAAGPCHARRHTARRVSTIDSFWFGACEGNATRKMDPGVIGQELRAGEPEKIRVDARDTSKRGS